MFGITKMNQTGQMGIIIICAIVAVVILPGILVTLFPILRILFQVFSAFMIYSIVKGYLGQSNLTIIITGILIWFLVFKYYYIFASLWMFQTLLGLQLFSVLIWGIASTRR